MDPDLFTMKVYHGGEIYVVDNAAKYQHGEVEYFDFCGKDFVSLIELQDFAERLGYEKNVSFYYKVNGSGSIGSFELLDNDMDVFGMVSEVGEDRVAELFMVVQPKPLKLDFAYSMKKPIVLSDDDDEDEVEIEDVNEDMQSDEDNMEEENEHMEEENEDREEDEVPESYPFNMKNLSSGLSQYNLKPMLMMVKEG